MKLHAKRRVRQKRMLQRYYQAIKKRQMELKKATQRANAIAKAKRRNQKTARAKQAQRTRRS